MALVNEGLRVLRDSVQRARYLATGSAFVSETGGKMDSGFLETIFELQMRAMEDPEVVKLEAQTLLNACMSDLEAIFRHWEESKGDLSMVEDCLGQMKYLSNLVDRP